MTLQDIRHFGRLVAQARRLANMSQPELCARLTEAGVHLDPPAISRIESGTRDVRLSQAIEIARILGHGISLDSTDASSNAGAEALARLAAIQLILNGPDRAGLS